MGKTISKAPGNCDTIDNLAQVSRRALPLAEKTPTPRNRLLKFLKRQISVGKPVKQFLEEAFHLSSKLVDYAKVVQASYGKDVFGNPDFQSSLLFKDLIPNIPSSSSTSDTKSVEILYISIHGLGDAVMFIRDKSKSKISNETLEQIRSLSQILAQLRQILGEILTEWKVPIPVEKTFDEDKVREFTEQFLKYNHLPENKLDSYRDFGLLYTVLLSAKPVYQELDYLTRKY